MAFQLNASSSQEIRIEGRSQKQILVLLLEAVKEMNWTIGKTQATTLIAFTSVSLFSFGERLSFEIDHENVTINSYCLLPQFYAFGKNKRNIRRLVEAVNQLWENYTEEELDGKYLQVSVALIPTDRPALALPTYLDIGASRTIISSFLSIFNPKPNYFITPILIDLNIFYFFCMVAGGTGFLSPNIYGLVAFGANFSLLTLDGQWWRLLTSQFMHAGILHLSLNMYALLFMGIFLEPILGSTRMLVYYLATGTIASLASLYMHPAVVAVGASGAIFGLFGLFLALLTSDLIDKPIKKALLTSTLLFVGLSLLNGIKGNTDNAAHIGGLLSGFIIGLLTVRDLKAHQVTKTIKNLAIVALSSIVICIAAYKTMPNDLNKYQEGIAQFAQYESMALRVYSMPPSTPREDITREIKFQSIGFWHQCTNLLIKLNKLRLPDKIIKKNLLLLDYCQYRLKNCDFELQRIQDTSRSDELMDSIELYNDRIHGIIYDIQE